MNKFSVQPQLQRRLLSVAIGTLFATAGTAHAQTADAPASTSIAAPEATVVVTGTRVSNRSVLDTASAVDVISAKTLSNNGVTEVSESLSKVLPALNFPRPGLTDGTDTVRPVTLRGLAPDQVLVLVNSKRRHASSLVNVNGTIGRGSASTDINTLPSGIINTVEVLRDGAAAQYGSDAIAGVINFRLRENRSGGALSATGGVRKTEYSFNPVAQPTGLGLSVPTERKRTDGQTYTVGGWKGFELGDNGFLTVAAELKQQQHSERSAYDTRDFYPRIGDASTGAFDPREQTANRYNTWSGDPNLKQATLFANAGQTLASGQKIYGWASYQRRESESAAFFRRPSQSENVAAIYPDGFLPIIEPTVTDFSAALGTTWSGQGWDYDTSLTYGKNKMAFDVTNTLNRSIGAASKTDFDAGGFAYEQLSANFSAVRPVDLAFLSKPLNVAVGAEARWENYELWAGEPDSYRYGGVLLANGAPSAPGAQGFPGYRPENAVDKGRHSTGAFIDLETNLTEKLLTSLAARAEHYSDFGSNVTGKLAARYDFVPEFAVRGSIQNGFRAPSPQQQLYTSTSTNFIGSIPYDIVTLRPTDAAAVALGAKPLDAEKSVNFSLGAVMRFGALSVTADAYRINIDNRIVLSENMVGDNVQLYLQSQGFNGIRGARFFINGVDTRTDGIDIVANYPWRSAAYGKFDFTLAGNYNKTEVKRVPQTAELAALNPAPVLFGRINIISLEKGQPKNKITASVNWEQAAWGVSASATRYGEIISAGTTAATDVTVSAKTIVNAEGRYAITKQTQLALGADNLFDIYPDSLPSSLTSNAAAPFSNRAPFGRGGRFVYARVNYTF